MCATRAPVRVSIDPENCIRFVRRFPFTVELRLSELADEDPAGFFDALSAMFCDHTDDENYELRQTGAFLLDVIASAVRDNNLEALHQTVADWNRNA